MLEIRSVSKRFGTLVTLEKIDLTLGAGQTHVLIGSSGSGKSTLLRAILGLIKYEEGQITVRGNLISSLSPAARAKQIGYVPQDAGLFPHLTAQENITLVARTLKWTQKQIADRLTELEEIVALDHSLLRRYPSEISGGQKQRVAILRALFLDPEILLLDEPFGALDPLVRSEIQDQVKDLFKRLKKTIVFVTHDVGEAAYLSDNVILLHKGQVVQQGSIDELHEAPATPFVTEFLNAQKFYVPSGKQ